MKRTAFFIVSALLVGTLSHAADTMDKHEATQDSSHNPITGTDTTTKKTKKKVKGADGTQHAMETTEKTKVHKDGTVEKSTKTESDSSEKH